MSKLAIGCLGLLWSVFSWAQDIPSVLQWRDVFQEVRQHALFQELDIRYAKAPAENVGYTPVGVILERNAVCAVVIAEGDNPKMRTILRFGVTPRQQRSLLMLAAAHELGHCLRVRHQRMSSQLWTLVADSVEDSPERHALEKQASIEEAYADAYALVYMQDAYPALFKEALDLMQALRSAPGFATPFYQVQPLYEYLARHRLDTSLPLELRVETAIRQSKFPVD